MYSLYYCYYYSLTVSVNEIVMIIIDKKYLLTSVADVQLVLVCCISLKSDADSVASPPPLYSLNIHDMAALDQSLKLRSTNNDGCQLYNETAHPRRLVSSG